MALCSRCRGLAAGSDELRREASPEQRDGRWKNVDYPEVIDRATYDG